MKKALGAEVTIRYDNDWFDSALVTVGSLGIVYAVVLEVRDEYKLRETRTEITWLNLKPLLANSSVFAADRDGLPDGVQVAINPGTMAGADPQCFLTKRVSVPVATPTTGGATFDPLGAFCEGNLMIELLFEAAKAVGKQPLVIPAILVALPSMPAVVALTLLFPPAMTALTVLAGTAAAAAGTAAAAASILYPLLKAAAPGAIGDLLGIVLDKHPDVTAAVASLLTKQAQSPAVAVDLAHQIMARRNKGECAARGLALELAFDTSDGSHIGFIDAALAMLRNETAAGHVLGGWFSIRFVGKSRAILSPQRSAMTCMVEVVGLRTLSSTKLLLSGLEKLGRAQQGVQHWGMFDDSLHLLDAGDVARAYPRLNTWRRIRWELTNGGTVHTFDNDFTKQCGLSDAPH